MADEGFLQRWSRRKAEARASPATPAPAEEPADEPDDAPTAAAPQPPAAARETRASNDAAAVDLDALPDIDSLTYDSDFTVFMRKGVPPELRKRALQRLWRSSPSLANLDGLVEYGEDYSQLGTRKQIVRTAYQIGRGMLARLEQDAAAEEPAPAGPERAAAGATEPPDAGAEETLAGAAGPPEAAVRTVSETREGEASRPARKPRPLPRRG
jgi:Protein of unknown function (DUF3306)